MTSRLKIIFTIILAILIVGSACYAIDINTANTTETLDGTSDASNIETNENIADTESNENSTSDTLEQDSMLVGSQSALDLDDMPESDLGLTNILSIILIAVGIVLILLGIAIIIKIK